MFDEPEGLLSLVDQVENQRRKAELMAMCAAGEGVLVAGAGLSKRLGYPDWSELLDKLYELASALATNHKRPFVRPADFAENPLRYADCLRDHIQACT